jgi:hypothetical protein
MSQTYNNQQDSLNTCISIMKNFINTEKELNKIYENPRIFEKFAAEGFLAASTVPRLIN